MRLASVWSGKTSLRRTDSAQNTQNPTSSSTLMTFRSIVGAYRHANHDAMTVAGSPLASATSARRFWKTMFKARQTLQSVGADAQLLQTAIHGAAREAQGLGRGIHIPLC